MISVEKEFRNIMTRLSISLLIFTILFPLLTGSVSVIGSSLTELFPQSDAVYIVADISLSLVYLVSFILPVVFFYIISGNHKKHPMSLELKFPNKRPAISYIALIFAGLALITPMTYVNSMLVPIPVGDAELFGFEFSEPYKLILAFISTAIVPAFSEELLFRGLLVSNLKPYGKGVAVIISAIAFGLMHQNPLQLLYATVAGIVLGIVYAETESIWCCIAIHFINNFISVMQTYGSYIFDEYTFSLFNFFFVVLVEIIGLICAILLFISLKKRNSYIGYVPQKSFWGCYETSILESEQGVNFTSVAFKTPLFVIYIVACALECVSSGIFLLVSSLGG